MYCSRADSDGGGFPQRKWPLNRWCRQKLTTAQHQTMSAQAVVIILPTIGRDLNIPEARVQWVVSAYSLAFGCLLLLWGRIADIFGRRKIFILGSAWVAVTTAVNPFLTNEIAFDLFRGLQGLVCAMSPLREGFETDSCRALLRMYRQQSVFWRRRFPRERQGTTPSAVMVCPFKHKLFPVRTGVLTSLSRRSTSRSGLWKPDCRLHRELHDMEVGVRRDRHHGRGYHRCGNRHYPIPKTHPP